MKVIVKQGVRVADLASKGMCWFIQPILKYSLLTAVVSVGIYWSSLGVLSLKETAFTQAALLYAKKFESVAAAEGFERTMKPLSKEELKALAFKVAKDKGDPDPKFFVSMVTVESAFDPNAFSDKGAMGLGQLMPANLKKYGIKSLKDAADPEKNLKVAWDMDYKNKTSVKGNPVKRLALYNWGQIPGKNGWMPEETREYIIKFEKSYGKKVS